MKFRPSPELSYVSPELAGPWVEETSRRGSASPRPTDFLGLERVMARVISSYQSWEISMAQLLVRNLDDDVKTKLQARARRHGRSTEEEARDILRGAVEAEGAAATPLGSRLSARFAGIGLDDDLAEWRGRPACPADPGG